MQGSIKTTKVEVRMSPEEKATLKEYAKKHNTTVSELVRQALNNIMYRQGGEVSEGNKSKVDFSK